MSQPPTASESGPGPRRSAGRSRAGGEPSVREPATKADLVLLLPAEPRTCPRRGHTTPGRPQVGEPCMQCGYPDRE